MERTGSKYAEGMRRLAEQWPYLRYLGMGAWWAWIWLCYSGTGLFAFWPQGSFAPQVGAMYLYSTPAIMCALVLAGILWRQATRLIARRGVVVGVSVFAVVGCALIACTPVVGQGALFVAGAVLTGMGTSVLALKTGAVYGTLGRREILTAGSMSLVFAAFLYFMGIGLPVAWQPAFIALMPLAGALLFAMPGDDPFPGDEFVASTLGVRTPGMRSYVRLVCAAVVVAVTAGFAKGIASTSMADADYAQTGAVVTFAIFAAALVICIVVNAGDIVRAVRRVYAALIIVGVVVVLASVFGGNLIYTSVGKELLWMMFTCLMAYMAFRFGFSPVRAFGFGQAAYLASSAASWCLGIALAPYLGAPSTYFVVVAVMVLAIVVVFAFIFTDADIKFIFTWKRGAPDELSGEEALRSGVPGEDGAPLCACPGDVGALIAAIPQRYGISAREAQIMGLFAQGRSANWIAEDLVISKNTVRSHIRSFYTKLDVHSRRELLDFLTALAA